jgi:hypothetical protein
MAAAVMVAAVKEPISVLAQQAARILAAAGDKQKHHQPLAVPASSFFTSHKEQNGTLCACR